MSFIELQYCIIPPPTSNSHLRQCLSPSSNEENCDECFTPMYHFQNSGGDKFNFEVPYSHAFFSEQSVNGCPRYLNVYLLGFDKSEELFLKYVDNVTRIDFFGCFKNPEICFRICSQLKSLREIRFNISGSKILDDNLSALNTASSWSGLKNSQVTSLSVIATSSKSFRCQEIINKYVEKLLEYSKDQFPNLRKLALELPDTDSILSLTRTFLRSTNLIKPSISVTLDESINVSCDATPGGSQLPFDSTQSDLPRPSIITKALFDLQTSNIRSISQTPPNSNVAHDSTAPLNNVCKQPPAAPSKSAPSDSENTLANNARGNSTSTPLNNANSKSSSVPVKTMNNKTQKPITASASKIPPKLSTNHSTVNAVPKSTRCTSKNVAQQTPKQKITIVDNVSQKSSAPSNKTPHKPPTVPGNNTSKNPSSVLTGVASQPLSDSGAPKTPFYSDYSYDISTTERLLRESAVKLDKKNKLIAERNELRDKLEANEEAEGKNVGSSVYTGKVECAPPASSGLPSRGSESLKSYETSPEPSYNTMNEDSSPPIQSQSRISNGHRSRSDSTDERQTVPRKKFVSEREMELNYQNEYHHEEERLSNRSRSRSRDGSRTRSPRHDRSPNKRRHWKGQSYSPERGPYQHHSSQTSVKQHSRRQRGYGNPNRSFRGHQGGFFSTGRGENERGYHH